MRDEYSVYWWDAEGNHHAELQFVGPEQAMKAMRRLTTGPAAQLGMVKRVMITNGGDSVASSGETATSLGTAGIKRR